MRAQCGVTNHGVIQVQCKARIPGSVVALAQLWKDTCTNPVASVDHVEVIRWRIITLLIHGTHKMMW